MCILYEDYVDKYEEVTTDIHRDLLYLVGERFVDMRTISKGANVAAYTLTRFMRNPKAQRDYVTILKLGSNIKRMAAEERAKAAEEK